MTTTLEAPPSTRRERSLLQSALVAAAVVAGYLLFDRWWTLHALPGISRHAHGQSLDAYTFLAVMAPYVLLALFLAVWGLDAAHRVAGGAVAVGAGLTEWGLQEVLQRYVFQHDHLTQGTLQAYDWTMTLVIPTLVALAWGLARRRGRVWVLGVAVAPLLAALIHQLRFHASWWQTWELRHSNWWVLRLEFLTPIVVAGIVCWLLESATRDRLDSITPERPGTIQA
jgi:hypothetical protein